MCVVCFECPCAQCKCSSNRVCWQDTERSLCANLAAANAYKQTHLESAKIQEVVKAAQVYYISGFFMTVSPESILSVAKHSFANSNKARASSCDGSVFFCGAPDFVVCSWGRLC